MGGKVTEKPEFKNWITAGNFITIAAMAIGAAVTWGVFSATTAGHARSLDDHESRIRAVERGIPEMRQEVLTGLMDIKGELAVVKSRLTSIEKAVKP